jgi:hypothetical protein
MQETRHFLIPVIWVSAVGGFFFSSGPRAFGKGRSLERNNGVVGFLGRRCFWLATRVYEAMVSDEERG